MSWYLKILKQNFEKSPSMKLVFVNCSVIPDCVHEYEIVVLLNVMKFNELKLNLAYWSWKEKLGPAPMLESWLQSSLSIPIQSGFFTLIQFSITSSHKQVKKIQWSNWYIYKYKSSNKFIDKLFYNYRHCMWLVHNKRGLLFKPDLEQSPS